MKTAPFALALSLFAILPARAHVEAGSPEDLRDGYYLLHKVCDQESQVSMIAMVKTTPPALAGYIKRISSLAHQSLDTLDRLAAGDRSLRDIPDPLPPFEIATRAGIKAEKQHQLLFGAKGPDFARTLLFTQLEATNYVENLSKVWAQRDPDRDRAQTLQKLSDRWLAIKNEGFRMFYQGE